MQWTNNKFITTLGISIVLAFGMISVVFGVIYISSGEGIPVPLPALLMAFAIGSGRSWGAVLSQR